MVVLRTSLLVTKTFCSAYSRWWHCWFNGYIFDARLANYWSMARCFSLEFALSIQLRNWSKWRASLADDGLLASAIYTKERVTASTKLYFSTVIMVTAYKLQTSGVQVLLRSWYWASNDASGFRLINWGVNEPRRILGNGSPVSLPSG